MIQNIPPKADTVIGGVMTTLGSVGITWQVMTGFASFVAVLLNIALAAGGIYLLRLRIKKAKRDLEK